MKDGERLAVSGELVVDAAAQESALYSRLSKALEEGGAEELQPHIPYVIATLAWVLASDGLRITAPEGARGLKPGGSWCADRAAGGRL